MVLVLFGLSAPVFGVEMKATQQEKLGIQTDFSVGGVRIVSRLGEGLSAQGGGVKVNAKIKAPVRNVKGLSASVKIEDESELKDDISLNGRHKVSVTPELEMKLNQVTVKGSTNVVRLISTKLNENEQQELLYTDYLRPSIATDYAVTPALAFGFKYSPAQVYDPDQILGENRARQSELRRSVNHDHELESHVKYRTGRMGLGFALGYNYGKQVAVGESDHSWLTKVSGELRATERMGLSSEFGVDTTHLSLENASFDSLNALRYSFTLGMKLQATRSMSVGALAQLSTQSKSGGRSTVKQVLGVSTSVAI